jgi:hypothetical protein
LTFNYKIILNIFLNIRFTLEITFINNLLLETGNELKSLKGEIKSEIYQIKISPDRDIIKNDQAIT